MISKFTLATGAWALTLACVLLGLSACTPPKPTVQYPVTEKVAQTDDYHGTKIDDPYRWLEVDTAAKVEAWVEAQNKVTFGYLEQIPYRNAIKDRITELNNYPKTGAPIKAGDYYLFAKNDGLQNQSVWYIQKGLDGTPEVWLDPNKLSDDGTVTVSPVGVSTDDKYVALRQSASGSDWGELRVREVATNKELPDVLKWVKFSGAAWNKDGFYYSRYDEPKSGLELSGANQNQKVYFHKLGTDQSKDVLVFEDPAHPQRYYGLDVSEDTRWEALYISPGTKGSEVRVRNAAKGEKAFKTILPGFEYDHSIIDNEGDQLLVYTNQGAKNYRVVRIDPAKPDPKNWVDVIAEKPEVLESVTAAGGKLFAGYLKDVTSRWYQLDRAGKVEREIVLPSLGTAGGFGGKRDRKEVFYSFTSFTYPSSVFKYDIATGTSTQFTKSEAKFNPDEYETKQVFFDSKDGTKVPMFIVHKKGLQLDGNRPTLLYAYGGFNVSSQPSFSAGRIALLEQGAVYALANIRGGGEYGEKWHEAGILGNKQNVFDDFIAAGEYLIKEKYTNSKRLAIQGGSNGGLLVGAVMTQRPELFGVAIPQVGVMDMLRYQRFTAGFGWVVEYGSADSSDAFKWLIKYSPLHNIKAGTKYPATLITTADHDDRVVPAHSFKFAATLQAAQAGPAPTLIRIETKSGHGAVNLTKNIQVAADIYSFMFYNMDYDYKPVSSGEKK
jgi:prolyl oligopeptidase